MATVRRKGKSPKKTLKMSLRKATNEQKEAPIDSSEDDHDSDHSERGQSPFSNMSLDVLAQVASATLEKEPRPKELQPQRRLTRRSIQSRDNLNLEQIQLLSDRSLVDFFADLKANEMRRNYTFVCYLMPEKCQAQFSSFGNETQARLKMKNHLSQHLLELEQLEKSNDELFSAEPLPARKRRLAEAAVLHKRKRKGITSAKNKVKRNTPEIYVLPKGRLVNLSELANHSPEDSESPSKRRRKFMKQGKDNSENASPEKHRSDDFESHTRKKTKNIDSTKGKQTVKQRGANNKKGSQPDSTTKGSLPDETERRIEENEQFIIDLLTRNQPHRDHCYTTIFGKKRGIDAVHLEMDSSDDEDGTVDVGDSNSYYGNFIEQLRKPVEPVLLFRRIPGEEGTPMVCCEEIVGGEEEEEEGHSGEKPYPPMPKSALAKKGRIPVPEENMSFSEDEDGTPKRKRKNTVKEGSAEWERKCALRCIRELKGRKKDDSSSPLMCKICKDKTFTACATLMYHYRSHAGIKPFVCLICNTTFTRQHSLNYHMLIHNNQSRFTCKDCGRKFRHPSHFKEHLRRHTGETPFECTDCPQKFKTRNTYKRHLKTRHGKLLTASGIHILSREEFLLVRTKPYRKGEESEEEGDIADIAEEDLLDSGEESENISVTDNTNLALPVITQSTNLPLHLASQQLSAPGSTVHGHVLPSGHLLVPVDVQFVMT
ncbi:zinc finger protein 37 homolog isoform X2 [Liolophura sinensis]|uniref:zinc finger protein 37 homolog isoform X2 n=1 Tax=Liolophura sinensis TaxID=3198878 RepID=UPI00315976DF